jgi:hypothetical protein
MIWNVVLHSQEAKRLEKFTDCERIREALRSLSHFPDVLHMLRIEDGLFRMRIRNIGLL